MIRKLVSTSLLPALLVLVLVMPAAAQTMQTQDPSGDFTFTLAPYAWLTGLSGKVGARGLETKVDMSFADMSKYLNFAAMGHAEMLYRDTLGLLGEFNYALLGDQASGKAVALDGQMNSIMSDVAAFYRLGTFPLGQDGSCPASFDLLAGARIWSLDMRLRADYRLHERSIHIQKAWVDPIVGGRAAFHLNKKWRLDFRAGVGGFGAGSAFTWDAMGLLDYTFWEHGRLLLGYRAVGVNYDQGSGRSAFKYNTVMHGPVIGLAFTF